MIQSSLEFPQIPWKNLENSGGFNGARISRPFYQILKQILLLFMIKFRIKKTRKIVKFELYFYEINLLFYSIYEGNY